MNIVTFDNKETIKTFKDKISKLPASNEAKILNTLINLYDVYNIKYQQIPSNPDYLNIRFELRQKDLNFNKYYKESKLNVTGPEIESNTKYLERSIEKYFSIKLYCKIIKKGGEIEITIIPHLELFDLMNTTDVSSDLNTFFNYNSTEGKYMLSKGFNSIPIGIIQEKFEKLNFKKFITDYINNTFKKYYGFLEEFLKLESSEQIMYLNHISFMYDKNICPQIILKAYNKIEGPRSKFISKSKKDGCFQAYASYTSANQNEDIISGYNAGYIHYGNYDSRYVSYNIYKLYTIDNVKNTFFNDSLVINQGIYYLDLLHQLLRTFKVLGKPSSFLEDINNISKLYFASEYVNDAAISRVYLIEYFDIETEVNKKGEHVEKMVEQAVEKAVKEAIKR